ncbi:uncharacterized protein I303_107507 [Kwoniella dejecticola CBS 10117]|uniref:BRCT domain-containing protein n=1 Tax=Kwoniella dejecticola CBS 10117 TaxID=1296121 RepID=A0A1A5ZZX0_9TREE|nr:uncharacterized protein I303_06912 [Kwoniella dejecticola CBS 10117]OBR83347.1 hypothetical protein I303_06912 [Kwoniella dejecticola CBS 10117]
MTVTEEQRIILDEIEDRGSWQKVLSSEWIDDCLKASKFLDYDHYDVTQIPTASGSTENINETDDEVVNHPDHNRGHNVTIDPQAHEQEIKNVDIPDLPRDAAQDSDSDDESVVCIGISQPRRPSPSPSPSRRPSPQEVKADIVRAVARRSRPQHITVKQEAGAEVEAGGGQRNVNVFSAEAKVKPQTQTQAKRKEVETPPAAAASTSKKKSKSKQTLNESRSTGGTPMSSKPRKSNPTSEEIDANVTLLVQHMRTWSPLECSRTCFLTEFRDKYNHKDWISFYKRHRPKIFAKFREMGYVYPGNEDVDEIEIQTESDEGSIYEP